MKNRKPNILILLVASSILFLHLIQSRSSHRLMEQDHHHHHHQYHQQLQPGEIVGSGRRLMMSSDHFQGSPTVDHGSSDHEGGDHVYGASFRITPGGPNPLHN
ncbi:hypothetical protein MLD38_020924 [Melastoma candidum]|uniref:Uncharacterized protein n=1 Tax=Melastoma candidum TaxID=119954 RepID=A0ACB9QDT4_9MYRT|nr:hypothetical protein MLD38_020924 [Melastoma candidum]